MASDAHGKKLGQILAKAWEDAAFKQRLLQDATTALKEEGLPVPEGLEVKVVENTEKVFHLVLPWAPVTSKLTTEQLAGLSGGGSQCNCKDSICGNTEGRWGF